MAGRDGQPLTAASAAIASTDHGEAADAALGFGALAVAAGAAAVLILAEGGPLSHRMVQHLMIMNVAAPMLASLLPNRRALGGLGGLCAAGALQMVTLWAWHAPAAQAFFGASPAADFVATLILFAAALWFWKAVLAGAAAGGWRSVGALLLTGKLACLLGALLVFAPRDLYAALAPAWCGSGPPTLADQQLAGLLMITACPLSYLVAGTTLAGRLLLSLHDRESGADVPATAR